MFRRLIQLSLFAALSALRFITVAALGPTKRSDHHLINGWTPKPTERPIPLRHERRSMWQQSYEATVACGSYVGLYGSPYFVCASGASCGSMGTAFGCCSTDAEGHCPVYTTCYESTEQNSCPSGDSNCLVCTDSDYTLCAEDIVHSGSTGTYTRYVCDSVRSTYTVVATTTGSTPPVSPSSPSHSAELPTAAQSSGVLPGTDGNTGGGVNTAAIAGGVVGGVAGLAILVGVPLGLMWRKRRQRSEAEKNVPEIAAQ